MNPWILSVIQFVVVLLLSPLSVGVVRWIKARLQGRQGASPFLPYVTLLTLMRKEMVISNSTSWVFRLAPFVVLATALFFVFILPLVTVGGAGASMSHLVVVAGVLALGALFLVFGGLESASAFGGMGASREMTIASLLEPVIIMAFGAFAIVAGSPLIDRMVGMGGPGLLSHPGLILSFLALLLVALAENARYPVDNPATHLELTMVHEAMVLEYSGPYLALLEYASAIKLTLFSLLVANFLFPMSLISSASGIAGVIIALLLTITKLFVVMTLLGLLENAIAKMRFYRIQEFISGAFFLGLGGMILVPFQSL